MIDISKPLELDDGRPVVTIEVDYDDVKVRYPGGSERWHRRSDGVCRADPRYPRIRNVATEPFRESGDQEFWERAYLAGLSNSDRWLDPETCADHALKTRNRKWPS